MKVKMKTVYNVMTLKEYAKKYGAINVNYAPVYREEDLHLEGKYIFISEFNVCERYVYAIKYNDEMLKCKDGWGIEHWDAFVYHLWWKTPEIDNQPCIMLIKAVRVDE